jgi:hypothetical protein
LLQKRGVKQFHGATPVCRAHDDGRLPPVTSSSFSLGDAGRCGCVAEVTQQL